MIPDRQAAAVRKIDITPLRHLLQLGTKRDATALVSSLLNDLQITKSGFEQAWKGPDFAALRANSHVLIALAGTIGDTDLHGVAQHLNGLAHGQSTAEVTDMKSTTMASLDDLISVLLHLHGTGGT